MSRISDADLVAAIELVYRDRYQRFLSLALGMLGDVDRARDAVQEAFAHALRSRGDLRQVESLNAWLWRTVVNVCRVERRHSVSGLSERFELEANGHPGDWPEVRGGQSPSLWPSCCWEGCSSRRPSGSATAFSI